MKGYFGLERGVLAAGVNRQKPDGGTALCVGLWLMAVLWWDGNVKGDRLA